MPDCNPGVFLIDKPEGPTSFMMVRRVRRALRIKKVGHAGTLDPFASGLLVVCAGRPATRLISAIMEGEKEYMATLHLGVETETLDPEGAVTARSPMGRLSPERIEECLQRYRGEIEQVPPKYSALKHQGKPLYYYARKGIEVTKESRQVTISTLVRTDAGHGLEGDEGDLPLRIVCSKGTYIRTLAADIGASLGCGAYLTRLRRTRSGIFSVDAGLPGGDLTLPDASDRLLAAGLSLEDVSKLLQ
ncbi:MAG: tRNA pseudouridine(55) synthase TruB [Desulfocapsaceae bacterium]|nr:tRNA pseudouridine(55) synthase TruB [Desulfocapsaceae bacterium]